MSETLVSENASSAAASSGTTTICFNNKVYSSWCDARLAYNKVSGKLKANSV
jgi:hypothetical protein